MRLCSLPPPPTEYGSPVLGRMLDPQWGWYALHRNILEFLERLPPVQVTGARQTVLADPDTNAAAAGGKLGLRRRVSRR